MSATFDDLNEDVGGGEKIKPLWSIDIEDEDELKKWIKADYKDKESRAFSRNIVYRKNICMYKGIQYKSQDSRELLFAADERTSRAPKIVVNQIFDLVETRISKLTRFRPSVAILPANDEYSDKQNARTAKAALDHRWYDVDIDRKLNLLELQADIFGESYIYVHWDKQAGDELPAAKRLRASGKESIETEDGKKINLKKRVRLGDVSYRNITPDRLLTDKNDCWDDVEHVTFVEYVNIEKLKARYPDKQKDIKENGERLYDITSLDDKRTFSDEVMVLHLFHKPTEEMAEGRYICATLDCILENIPFPYSHGEIPFVRQTDIDVPGELHGRSFVNQVLAQQKHYNHIMSAIARNHGIAAAPKWIMPKGACDIKTLNNEITVVEYKGPIAPRLERMEPTPREMFEHLGTLRAGMEQGSGIHAVSRGQPPAGIKSGIALQFLDEQENERANNRVSKRNSVILKLAKLSLSLMGQFYKEDDERMIKILGPDGSLQTEIFKATDWDDSYDVRIQKASFLPEQKATRVQTIIDLREAFPTLLPDEIVADLLDLAQDQKFKDLITVNVRSAEAENEAMSRGKEVHEPAEWEDHLVHYRIHLMSIQQESFKTLPPEVQQLKKDHILTTEYLMVEQAKKNPVFGQKLLMFDNFPIFFDPGVPLASMIQPPQPPASATQPMMPDDAVNGLAIQQGQEPLPQPEATLINTDVEQPL